MVVEEIFKTKWVEKRPLYSFLIGVFFTSVSFLTSLFLFRITPNFIGISTILFTVALVIPTINKLFDKEEKLEAKEKLKFFVRHEHLFDFFIYFFIGVFMVLFTISLINPAIIFSEQQLYNLKTEITTDGRQLPLPPVANSDNGEIIRIFKNNLFVLLVSFGLSLFYGAGALFLITLNASIFASALAKVIKSSLPGLGLLSLPLFTLCNLGIFLFHGIPEVVGYILAAIAGGVLSHAFVREKIRGKRFKSVLTDSVVLLLVGIALLAFAAFVENEISKELYTNNVCAGNNVPVILILGIIILVILLIENFRNKKFRRK
jgi:hypothetical protein